MQSGMKNTSAMSVYTKEYIFPILQYFNCSVYQLLVNTDKSKW